MVPALLYNEDMETKHTLPEFSVVATPIGNMEDITIRALTTLRNADVIFCEDTRVTKKILARYEIATLTRSYHAHSGERGKQEVLLALKQGKKCALATDAGTPGISDPGPELISFLKSELPNLKITPIPGADAVTTLLSAAGIPTQPYAFFGFLPTKKGRQTLIAELISDRKRFTVVFYESTHRILKLIQELRAHDYKDELIIGKELTKMHEQILEGTPNKIEGILLENPALQKGEFVIALPKISKKVVLSV